MTPESANGIFNGPSKEKPIVQDEIGIPGAQNLGDSHSNEIALPTETETNHTKEIINNLIQDTTYGRMYSFQENIWIVEKPSKTRELIRSTKGVEEIGHYLVTTVVHSNDRTREDRYFKKRLRTNSWWGDRELDEAFKKYLTPDVGFLDINPSAMGSKQYKPEDWQKDIGRLSILGEIHPDNPNQTTLFIAGNAIPEPRRGAQTMTIRTSSESARQFIDIVSTLSPSELSKAYEQLVREIFFGGGEYYVPRDFKNQVWTNKTDNHMLFGRNKQFHDPIYPEIELIYAGIKKGEKETLSDKIIREIRHFNRRQKWYPVYEAHVKRESREIHK